MSKKIPVLIFLILFSTFFSFFRDNNQNLDYKFFGPSFNYWMGTDHLGRDLFLRVCNGTKVSIFIGIIAGLLSLVLGFVIESVSYFGSRWIRIIVSSVLDLLLVIPPLLLSILVTLVFGTSMFSIIISLGISGGLYQAKYIHSLSIQTQTLPHVEAAEALGVGKIKLLRSHIFAVIFFQAFSLCIVQIPGHILTESFLSFLGLGVQLPEYSLGSLARDGWKSVFIYPHLVLFPSIVLFVFVFLLQGLKIDGTKSYK